MYSLPGKCISDVLKNIFPFRKRAPYIAYLTRCRQGLQTTQAHLERLLQRVLRDKEVANRYFTTVCVRLLLESKEKKIREFIQGTWRPLDRASLSSTSRRGDWELLVLLVCLSSYMFKSSFLNSQLFYGFFIIKTGCQTIHFIFIGLHIYSLFKI